ncbi:hypothetical protein PPYR_06972 [Photinus pyralis]|uniref:Metallothionein n=1 Tax=Photinus pyralis TaxID=7054 RepID=A0A1Y1L469_PHOPY|nr:uncharacterized protein LOC116169578 [Photinus pyralis]KAB0799092.1 hypothetical protein PPYR_06972 [Photinus pyralis]
MTNSVHQSRLCCCSNRPKLCSEVNTNKCNCCKCPPKIKGKFGLAWVTETQDCKSAPVGWQVEFIDTPSRVFQKCRNLVDWVKSPPIACSCSPKITEQGNDGCGACCTGGCRCYSSNCCGCKEAIEERTGTVDKCCSAIILKTNAEEKEEIDSTNNKAAPVGDVKPPRRRGNRRRAD